MGQQCCSSADPEELANTTPREDEQSLLPGPGPNGGKDGRSKWGTCGRCCCCSLCVLLLVAAIIGLYLAQCVVGMMQASGTMLPGHEVPPFFNLMGMVDKPFGRLPAQWEAEALHMNHSWNQGGETFGYVSAEDGPTRLYEASKVDGKWDLVPNQLRGVYWMKGNLMAQVLVTFQYGMWYNEARTLLVPNSPWTRAWYGGRSEDPSDPSLLARLRSPPSDLSLLGKAAYLLRDGKSLAEASTEPSGINTTMSIRFEADSLNATDFTFASVMTHPDGDLAKNGEKYFDGYSMEAPDGIAGPAGAVYFRQVSFLCGKLSGGNGYNLTKIIDGNGLPLEPYFSEYQAFMNNTRLIVWSATKGFES